MASRAAAVVLAAILAIGVAACGKSVGDTIDDATITTQIKTALLNDPEVAGLKIDVDTFQGVVTLSGRVATRAEEAKAIEIARRTGGVKDVKSTLQIGPS
jgi:hyperosmotically inducible protein